MAVPPCSHLSTTHWTLLRASRFRKFPSRGAVTQCRSLKVSSRVNIPEEPPFSAGGDAVGFAFDIDGVLLRGKKPIPGASATLEKLKARHIPFVLLTNGGGKHETERARELSELLETPISSKTLIQSHTPFQNLVHKPPNNLYPAFRDKCVLVIGGEGNKCRDIAESYGFENVVTPADIVTANPAIWPFANLEIYRPYARPLPKPLCPEPIPDDQQIDDYLRIFAILVFHDSRDWGLDTQIILDVMRSYMGYIGVPLEMKKRRGPGRRPYLMFSNPDEIWQSDFKLPRLGQGAFRSAVIHNFQMLARKGTFLHNSVGGKPSPEQFAFAHQRLLDKHQALLNNHDIEEEQRKALGRVYMIGDNPDSDILGANRYTMDSPVPWFPILTRTGVFDEIKKLHLTQLAVQEADDVSAAVEWALEDARSPRQMDLRPWEAYRKFAKENPKAITLPAEIDEQIQ